MRDVIKLAVQMLYEFEKRWAVYLQEQQHEGSESNDL